MKKLTTLSIFLACGLGFGAQHTSAQLLINELMQSNIDCVIDDLNEFPDSWVELYNIGDKPEQLYYYSLGDSEDSSKAYHFPGYVVNPGEYVIIYCDKEGHGLHTNFRIDSGKGASLYLFLNGEVVDQVVEMKKQPAPNIAYGRITDGATKWGYQLTSTPGGKNTGETTKEILGEPVFSEGGKLFETPFDLTLSVPEGAPEGTAIHYTLDGSEPSAQSPAYTTPISVSGTTVVRAKLLHEKYLSPRSTTHSYICHQREVTMPVVSIVTDNDYFYGDKHGIYVEGNYNEDQPNYRYDWRRPINFELFDNGEVVTSVNQLCETRVKGYSTRPAPIKSLVVYANKRFGVKRIEKELFPEDAPNISKFKSIELRNAGNDFNFLYMRDAVIQKSMGSNCDLDWQPSQPAIIYINGMYKGILNIRPRSNEDYVYSFYDGLEDIDMIESWVELKEGSFDNFNKFKEFYSIASHSFEEYEKMMDTGEFCNLMIMNIFYDNKDFPANNIIMWRPQAEDGRWRWIAKDVDYGIGLWNSYSYPTLMWITTPGYDKNYNWGNSEEATLLFRNLLETPEFKEMFINRCAVYLGDFLTTENIVSLIKKRYDEILFEYSHHMEAAKDDNTIPLDQALERALGWCEKRPAFFYDHLAEYFGLNKSVPLSIYHEGDKDWKFSINDVPVVNSKFDGRYFPDRTLTVKQTIPNDDNPIKGWTVKVNDGEQVNSTYYQGEVLSIQMPQGENVEINPVMTFDSVDEIFSDKSDAPGTVYDLNGRVMGVESPETQLNLSPGIYLKSGSKYIVK